MTTWAGLLRRWAFGCAVVLLAAPPAVAEDFSNNVAFTAANLSPWDSGPAVDLNQVKTLSKSFSLDLPTINPDPVKALADFLGVPLPFDASVSIGAHTDGSVALDLGYAVTSGHVNMTYPAIGTISIPTEPGTNTISSSAFTITTAFQPGLHQSFVPSQIQLQKVAGGGYTIVAGDLGLTTTGFTNPVFTTSFPSFAAWADAYYDVNAGASINADLKVLGECIVCASKTFTLHSDDTIPIVELDPGHLKVPVLKLDVPLASTTIPIVPGEVSLTVNVPNLKVGGGLQAGTTTLAGSGSQPIIQLNLSLEKLVPVIGAFLSNSIGPFGYNLLSVDGGPNLSLYQNFSFTPHPLVQLDFSQDVLVQGSNGLYRPTRTVTFNLGDPINVKIPFGTQNLVTVQPTYFLDNTFSNETGIRVGAQVTVSGLKLTSSFGDLGPAFTDTVSMSIPGLEQLQLYSRSFEEPFGSIKAKAFTIDVGSHLSELLQRPSLVFDHVTDTDVPGQFQIRFRDTQTGEFLDAFTTGQLLSPTVVCPPNIDICSPIDQQQSILLADQDVFLNVLIDGVLTPIDIGDTFCVFCSDFSSLLTGSSPLISDDQGNELFLSDLSVFPSGDCESQVGLCDGTFAPENVPFDPSPSARSQSVVVGPTIVVSNVPEPSALQLLAGGAGAWLLARRLRRRDRGRRRS